MDSKEEDEVSNIKMKETLIIVITLPATIKPTAGRNKEEEKEAEVKEPQEEEEEGAERKEEEDSKRSIRCENESRIMKTDL